MFGASSSVISRRHASWPARKDSNSARSRSNSGPCSSASEKWMWHELPSRWSYFAMKLIAMPSSAAISLAPFLKITCSSAVRSASA